MLVQSIAKLPNLRSATRVAFDLETYDPHLRDLGPGVRRDGYVLGVAMATPDGGTWYVPLRHTDVQLPPEAVWAWVADAFTGATVYGANLTYDLDYAAEAGVPVPEHVRDLLHAGRLLYLQGKFPSLDELLQRHLPDAGGKTGDELWQWLAEHRGKGEPTRLAQIGHLRLAPAALVAEYAEGDVAPLFRLWDVLEPLLRERHARDWYDVESALLPYLLLMRRRGIRVNVAAAEELQHRLGEEHNRLLEEFGGLAYPDLWDKLADSEKADLAVAVNSGMRLADLFQVRGITVPRTWAGAPSVTKDWLQAQDDDLARVLLALRQIGKVSGTFVESYILKHQINGRIHPELNQLFPRTLRFSSQNPNEQNIPARDEKLAPLIRGLFLPEEGEDWVRLDFDQQEYRLLCHYAVGRGAKAARAAYRDDPTTDFHALVQSWVPQIGDRKVVKNANFAKTYRAGKAKFAATLGVSLEEGTRIFDLYDQILPFVRTTAETAERAARQRGYVKLLLHGMRMYFDHWAIDDWDVRRAAGGAKELAQTYPTREEAERVGNLLAERLHNEGKLNKAGRVKVAKADLYKALNRVIQPSGAQLMKNGLVRLHRAGLTSVLGPALLSIHDEVDFSVPRTREGAEAVQEAAHLLATADEGEGKVPFRVAAERGPSWGELAHYDPTAAPRKPLVRKRR